MFSALPPKPRSTAFHSELIRLPRLTPNRMLFRRIFRGVVRLLVWLFIRAEVHGLENVPKQEAALIVTNHLGDADLLVGIAFSPRIVDTVAKVELYDLPVLGKLLEAYGVIWIHRGQPDRSALRAVMDGLSEGRLIIIAPEGRESAIGALEEGTNGAAYLALKSGAPILPVTLIGTENDRIYGNLKRLRRTRVTLTIGKPFYLEVVADDPGRSPVVRQSAIQQGTRLIMHTLASQLPPEYRGVYQAVEENSDGG